MAGYDYHKKQLRERIAAREAVVIVGAGVSTNAGGNSQEGSVSSWPGLLANGIAHCSQTGLVPHGWATERRAELGPQRRDALLHVGQEITTVLGGQNSAAFQSWLQDSVGALHTENNAVLRALSSWGVPIATTNYDGLIEETTGLPAITWQKQDEAVAWIKGMRKAVLHLHGQWETAESVILGRQSYDRMRKDADAQAMLRTLATAKALIFVGFADRVTDLTFGPILPWVTQALRDRGCYQLVLESDLPQFKSPEPLVIQPVSYGEHPGDLDAFLQSLSPAAVAAARAAGTGPAARLPALPRVRGRETEVDTLVRCALQTPPQPVAVVGGAGIGKSTVTIAALHDTRLAEHFGKRRYFVRLEGAPDTDSLIGGVAAEIGALVPKEAVSPAQLLDSVIESLSTEPSLLVLDGFETPWMGDRAGTETLLTTILRDVPALALAISLSGRDYPQCLSWTLIEVGRLEAGPERNIFLDTAGPQFGGDSNLYELLRGLDGVPLAIELMAYASQGDLDLKTVLRQWQEYHAIMLKRTDADPDLLNLEVSIEIAIQGRRMHRSARTLLSLLALLPDGVALVDLLAIFPGAEEEMDKAARSLRRVGLAYDEAQRIRLPGPIRAYVLAAHASTPIHRDKLIDHYLQFAIEKGAKLGTEDMAEAATNLQREARNIEAAIALGLEPGYESAAVQAACALGKLSCCTGLGETRTLTEATAYARSVNDLKGEADCLYRLGEVAATGGNTESAAKHYGEALALYEQIPDPYSIGWVHLWLADIAPTDPAVERHVEAARAAWQSIGRQDLIDEYFTEE